MRRSDEDDLYQYCLLYCKDNSLNSDEYQFYFLCSTKKQPAVYDDKLISPGQTVKDNFPELAAKQYLTIYSMKKLGDDDDDARVEEEEKEEEDAEEAEAEEAEAEEAEEPEAEAEEPEAEAEEAEAEEPEAEAEAEAEEPKKSTNGYWGMFFVFLNLLLLL